MTADPFTSVQTNAPKNDREPANVERDGYGRYKIPPLPADFREQFKAKGYADPGPGVKSWTRVTTFARAISDTFNLSQWSQRMVAKGIATRPDLYAGAAACQVSDRKTLDSIVEQAKDAAAARAGANLGTAYHSFTEAIDRGEEPNIPDPQWRKDLDGYVDLKNRNTLVALPNYIERTVVNTRWDVAGTLDRIYNDSGVLRIGDVKSGKSMDYDNSRQEITIQLLCYATADAIWDWDRRAFLPLPAGLDQERAIVVHLPVGGKPGLYDVLIGEAVPGADLCRDVRAWRKTKGLFTERGRLSEDFLAYGTPEPAPEIARGIAAVSDRVAGGTELAPLAGPGQRGCSVCGRTGHRKGSPKCLGDADPNIATTPEVQALEDAIEKSGLGPQWCLRTGPCSNAGWTWTNAEKDGPMVCGNCGKPSRSGQINGTGAPVVGTIGMPSDADQQAYDYAAQTISPEFAKALAPNHQSVIEKVAAESARVHGTEDDDLFTSVQTSTDTEATPIPGAVAHKPGECPVWCTDEDHGPADDEDGGDPFADDESAPLTWSERIAKAESKADIRAIRDEATAAGEWTKALMSEGIARLSSLDK